MSVLTNRALLLDEFFRLVDADITDDSMIEHDPTAGDGAYILLQAGCFDAQLYLISCGAGSRWAKTTSALTFTGADPDRYVALPSDFLRLESDHERSGLRTTAGVAWGREIPFRNRFDFHGNHFYMRGNEAASGSEGQLRLYVVRGAAPLSGMVADYIYKHATLADATTIDFDSADRQMIPAFAAVRASHQSWYSGDGEDKQALRENLAFVKQQAWQRSRFSAQPKMIRPHAMMGDRWY